jgi:hypothetical protein
MDEFEYLSLLDNAMTLVTKKQEDYQSATSTITLADYFPFGHKSYVQMLHTKVTRLRSLVEAIVAGIEPNFESIEDSVNDLINYAVFYLKFLKS